MRCLDDLDVLDFIDERLAPQRNAEVRDHLDGCTECLNLVAQLTGMTTHAAIDGLTLGRTISSGGMGVVVEAFDAKLERRIAVKLPRSDDPLAQCRFEREVKITARLQHPAIVPVYAAGTLGDGEQYYAMRLVDGDTLDVAIDRAKTLAERLALVRAVSTVASAIAYAHSQGVLHRDIKPANILVGRFGEVVVIDWGLARETAAADDEVPLARGSAPVDETRTVDGAVVGTPAYMAPEQARGEPLDERADVFAIGALLFHVLRGSPPRGGHGDLGTALPELPRDLVAIVAEAMAPDPAHRYRTAAELAADLERFQAGQLVGAHAYSFGQLVRRWMRKHRGALTASAIALVVLGAFGAWSLVRIVRAERVAETQRERAVAHREDAEELMDFMLVDLRDKLMPLGQLELLDTVAQKARSYYEQHADGGDPVERQQRAMALQNVGDVLVDRGDLPSAIGAYRSALVIHQSLLAATPDDEGVQRSLGITHERIGEVLAKQGDEAGALASYRAGFASSAVLAAAKPDDIERQYDLAISHKWVGGSLLVQGQIDAALVEFRAALAIAQRASAAVPSKLDWQRGVSVAHSRIGDALLRQGDLAGALVAYRASMAINERLASSDATNLRWQQDLVRGHQELGEVLRAQGDAATALQEYRTARVLAEKLVATDPTNTAWLRDVETSRNRAGETLEALKDLPSALVEFRAALAIAEKLAATDATNVTWQRDLSVGHEKVAGVLVAHGAPAAALPHYEASLAIGERLASAEPTDLDLQRDRLVSFAALAEAHRAAGDRANAIAHYRKAVEIAATLAQRTPPPPTAQEDLAEVQRLLAAILAK